jgi:uncharacterized membrane protein YphA (DoxX/SURF4 family)
MTLVTQLASWLPMRRRQAGGTQRIIPGAVFARYHWTMLSGVALALGFWTRIAAAISLVLVLSLQVGAASMFRYAYLMDANGLPLVGGLLALVIGGETRGKEKRRPKSG